MFVWRLGLFPIPNWRLLPDYNLGLRFIGNWRACNAVSLDAKMQLWFPEWAEQFYFWTAIHHYLKTCLFSKARRIMINNPDLSP